MTFQELKSSDVCKALIASGWIEFTDPLRTYARCFARYFPATPCACNQKEQGIQVVLSVSRESGRMELHLSGELADETWIQLMNYSLPLDVDAVLALIPRMIAIWEAANAFKSEGEA